MKNKDNGTSYERFRRQSSLSSVQTTKNSVSLSSSLAKLKNINPMEEVQNLSMQLDNLSKRSLTARNITEHPLGKSYSSSSLKDVLDPIPLKRQLSTNLSEQTALKDSDKIQLDANTPRGSRYKFSNSVIFNQFDIIEEDSYLNEEETAETLAPVTFKACSNLKLNDKKQSNSKNGPSKFTQAIRRQTATTLKQQFNTKKDKMKQDISQLDKMQKQLDLKRITRDQVAPKLNQSTFGATKRNKEPTFKDSVKGLKKSLHLDSRPQFDNPIRSHRSFKPELVLPPKTNETSCPQTIKKQQLKHEPVSDEKCQRMAATRMLTDKQKSVLTEKINNLRDIIDKNEICSDGLDKITTYMNRIQQLLTQ